MGAGQHTLLFDTGPEGAIFLRNCANLGLNLADVEGIAVSHGHWDHMGALTAAVEAIAGGGGQVTVQVNRDMFYERAVRLDSGTIVPMAKVPSVAELQACGARLVNRPEARRLLDDHFYYSGEIPRVTPFEKGRLDHLSRRNEQSPWEPDPLLMDERMLVVHVRGLGLIVFSACSHAGIVNVCIEVRTRFPKIPIYSIMGGLHLGGIMEQIIPDTVEGLRPFAVKQIITGHCTGWRALRALADTFGEAVSQSAVGTTYTFDRHTGRVAKLERGLFHMSIGSAPDITQLPVNIITGFLGSRKTTLVNHILTNHKLRVAVIVNEIGEIGIDSDLIVSTSDNMLELSNGCICCSINIETKIRTVKPDARIIRTTGCQVPLSLRIGTDLFQRRLRRPGTLVDYAPAAGDDHLQNLNICRRTALTPSPLPVVALL
jgi:7,8-dihydropterin-6-yl-methyl-4-(beta-D-ribofuranosyl)aminobenzene 5'-phosphate synthase